VGLCEPHEVQQGQVQAPAPGWVQSPLSTQAAEKGLGVLVDEKLDMS